MLSLSSRLTGLRFLSKRAAAAEKVLDMADGGLPSATCDVFKQNFPKTSDTFTLDDEKRLDFEIKTKLDGLVNLSSSDQHDKNTRDNDHTSFQDDGALKTKSSSLGAVLAALLVSVVVGAGYLKHRDDLELAALKLNSDRLNRENKILRDLIYGKDDKSFLAAIIDRVEKNSYVVKNKKLTWTDLKKEMNSALTEVKSDIYQQIHASELHKKPFELKLD